MDEITFRDGDDTVRLLSSGDVEFYAGFEADGTVGVPDFVINLERLKRILSTTYMLRQEQAA